MVAGLCHRRRRDTAAMILLGRQVPRTGSLRFFTPGATYVAERGRTGAQGARRR